LLHQSAVSADDTFPSRKGSLHHMGVQSCFFMRVLRDLQEGSCEDSREQAAWGTAVPNAQNALPAGPWRRRPPSRLNRTVSSNLPGGHHWCRKLAAPRSPTVPADRGANVAGQEACKGHEAEQNVGKTPCGAYLWGTWQPRERPDPEVVTPEADSVSTTNMSSQGARGHRRWQQSAM
jgi:hypothetical protein